MNPPVHAWATLFLHRFALEGEADLDFLKQSFLKLALNFHWWVNRKDRTGKNVFEGGFLGLDNIGVFDRSSALPTGGYLDQADGTAWMAFFSQNMIELSAELAAEDHTYTDMCTKFVEHFGWIASGMNRTGPSGMWDEEDGFYYDVLRLPDGSAQRLKVRSMVGPCRSAPRRSSKSGSGSACRRWSGPGPSAWSAHPSFCRACIRLDPGTAASPIAASSRW